jgi:hypothetical protein
VGECRTWTCRKPRRERALRRCVADSACYTLSLTRWQAGERKSLRDRTAISKTGRGRMKRRRDGDGEVTDLVLQEEPLETQQAPTAGQSVTELE